ncbi:MAG: putative glutathione peroxidase [Ramlibacter sp.]|jgi:glutathione peroxidase|nr:putative glutathione peroxidase [Ramlibacter sp.]
MKLQTVLALALGASLAPALPAATPAAPGPVSAVTADAACPALLRHTFPRLQDEKPQSLCQYQGKVLLVVNTASFCGFTYQYEGLEKLHARYKDRGFVVLGFPSNDFAQEKGSNKEIADFCENTFGVKFPMFGKTAVRGSDANALFKELAAQTGRAPLWNFHKYLIGRDGKVVANYASLTKPDDAALVKVLEQQLAAR